MAVIELVESIKFPLPGTTKAEIHAQNVFFSLCKPIDGTPNCPYVYDGVKGPLMCWGARERDGIAVTALALTIKPRLAADDEFYKTAHCQQANSPYPSEVVKKAEIETL
jgi:hypothetical protein